MSALNELRQLKGVKQEGTDNKAAYLFLLPWLIGLVVITIGPMIASLYLSFTDYNLLSPPDSLIPVFLAFLFGQRFLIRGIATTGIK